MAVRLVNKKGVSDTQAEIIDNQNDYSERDVIFCIDTQKTFIHIDGSFIQFIDGLDKRLKLNVVADYTMLFYDYNVFVTTGASDVTITLPLNKNVHYVENTAKYSKVYNIQKADSGVGRVIIVPNATELIMNEDSFILTEINENVTVYLDTLNWMEI